MIRIKIPRIKSLLPSRSNSRNVLTVMTGTLLGQGIIIATTPLLTRLYSPAEMGIYSVFVAIAGLFSVTIALHYELAIPLPKGDAQAKLLFKIALLVAVASAILIGSVLVVGRDTLLPLLQAEELHHYTLLIPISLILIGWATVFGIWATRKRSFNTTALSKGTQGFGQSVPQILFGLGHFGTLGLIGGQLIGTFLSVLILSRAGPKERFWQFNKIHLTKLWLTAKKFKRFPLLTTISSFIYSLSSQLPILLLAHWFSAEVTGYYALSFRVLQVPARFIGQSVSQVFFPVAATSQHKGNLAQTTSSIFGRMVSFCAPTFLIVALIAPELFTAIFGANWREAGIYTQLLMPWIFFTFITTTLNILISVLHKQAEEVWFQLAYAVAVGASLFYGGSSNNPAVAIGALSAVGSVGLAIKIAWLLKLAGVSLPKSLKYCINEIPLLALAAIATISFKSAYPDHPWTVTIFGLSLLTAVHLINASARNVYGLRKT